MKKTALCLIALIVFIAGCKGKDSGKVELNFFEVLTSANRTQLFNKMIEEYQEKNQNIKINLISPPYEQADNKLLQMLNAKQALDVIEVRDYTVNQLANNGHLLNIEKYIENWEHKDGLLPATLDSSRTVQNTAYMLSYLFFAKSLFVRNDAIAEMKAKGIKVPTTVNEFFDAGIKLTDPSKNKFGYAMRGKNYTYGIEDNIILANVKDIDEDRFYWTTDGTFVYNRPEVKKALADYYRLYKQGVPKDGINWGFTDQVNAFASGVCAFLIQDPDSIGMIDDVLGAENYTTIPLPLGDDSGKSYQTLGFAGLGVTSYSKNPDEAWDFISFIVSPENNGKFCFSFGAIPVHATIFDNDPNFANKTYQSWKTEFNNPDKWVFVKYPFDDPKFPGWAAYREQTMHQYLLGDDNLENTVKKWEDYWTKK